MQTVSEEAGGCWTQSRRLGPGPRNRNEVDSIEEKFSRALGASKQCSNGRLRYIQGCW